MRSDLIYLVIIKDNKDIVTSHLLTAHCRLMLPISQQQISSPEASMTPQPLTLSYHVYKKDSQVDHRHIWPIAWEEVRHTDHRGFSSLHFTGIQVLLGAALLPIVQPVELVAVYKKL